MELRAIAVTAAAVVVEYDAIGTVHNNGLPVQQVRGEQSCVGEVGGVAGGLEEMHGSTQHEAIVVCEVPPRHHAGRVFVISHLARRCVDEVRPPEHIVVLGVGQQCGIVTVVELPCLAQSQRCYRHARL